MFCHPRKAIHGPEIQQPPTGQEESELASDKELEGSLTSYQNQQGVLSPLPASGKKIQPTLVPLFKSPQCVLGLNFDERGFE